MTEVILITGTPGVGKTTLADTLQDHGYHTFNILELAKLLECTEDFDEARDALIINDELLFEHLKTWLPQHSDEIIIVEGHIADVIPKEFLLRCFVLNPSIETLRPRLVDRGYSEDKINENIEAHIMQECIYDALEYYGEEDVEIIEEDQLDSVEDTVLTFLSERN